MSIPYRDEQILRILAAHPDGLTTGKILAIAKSQRGNELPDSNITSQRIYALRETKTPKIESRDTADGRIHKLTAAGRALLAELGPNDFLTAKPEPTGQGVTPAANLQRVQTALTDDTAEIITLMPDEIDPLEQFDSAVGIIREGLIAALETSADPIEIADKQEKIELLEKLENMTLLKPELRELLGEIRRDLDRLEAQS
jgi:hypothetical protein